MRPQSRARALVVFAATLLLVIAGISRVAADPPGPTLPDRVAALEAKVAALQALLAYISVVPGAINGLVGPHLIITGANVHIRSGSGETDDAETPTGLGNLVIGYNENTMIGTPQPRTGAHNLVVGPFHGFTDVGGFVAGFSNSVTGAYSTVSGGYLNTASGDVASVSGGTINTASGIRASVSGGFGNTASGEDASVSGGAGNTASGNRASVSGGTQNTASFDYASVSGGFGNTASGQDASVSGGHQREAAGAHDWRAGGLFQDE